MLEQNVLIVIALTFTARCIYTLSNLIFFYFFCIFIFLIGEYHMLDIELDRISLGSLFSWLPIISVAMSWVVFIYYVHTSMWICIVFYKYQGIGLQACTTKNKRQGSCTSSPPFQAAWHIVGIVHFSGYAGYMHQLVMRPSSVVRHTAASAPIWHVFLALSKHFCASQKDRHSLSMMLGELKWCPT